MFNAIGLRVPLTLRHAGALSEMLFPQAVHTNDVQCGFHAARLQMQLAISQFCQSKLCQALRHGGGFIAGHLQRAGEAFEGWLQAAQVAEMNMLYRVFGAHAVCHFQLGLAAPVPATARPECPQRSHQQPSRN